MPILKDEKRRFPRVAIKVPLRWQIRGRSEPNDTINQDIGLGGISFVNEQFLATNIFINIQMNLAAQIIKAAGRIANVSFLPYSDKYRIGIEFLEFELKEKRILSDYINAQAGMKKTVI